MTAVISAKRILSLSCIEGLRLLRHYAAMHPNLSNAELLSLIEHVEADGLSLDLAASAQLEEIVENTSPMDGVPLYQACIQAILLKHRPSWSKSMLSGRSRFMQTLNPDEQDVFAAAGLLDNPLPTEVIEWWDDTTSHARAICNQEKMKQARKAERLTLDRELQKLRTLGLPKQPEWLGLNDNFAGYDVLSYDITQGNLVEIFIEVKSTVVSPLRFIISRQEWEKAKVTGSAYLFHIWDMKPTPPKLHKRTVEDIAPHIPNDNGRGKWTYAEIPI